MDDNNSFLTNYADNMGPETAPGPGYKYEEKSGFKKPPDRSGGPSPSRRAPRYLVPAAVAAGALLIAAAILVIALSGGGVKVLDFTGWSLNDAQLWASSNGVLLKTDSRYDDKYENGKVISQDVPAGSTVRKGDFLTLSVSLGHDPSVTLPLPDIMSMTMDEVQKWADDNFMTKVRITAEYSDSVPSGRVIRYEINDSAVAGKVRRDTPVYVIVSKGPKDAASVLVTVPDFKTMSVSECYIFAKENGITLFVAEQYDDYVPKGTVISQSVKATEKVSKGSEIKIIVSKGKMITVPDFSRYTKDEAASVAASLGIPAAVIEKYSGKKAGAFISQSLEADSVYREGDYLELYYSLGNTVAVSSYVGQTRDSIESWAAALNAQGAGITIKVTTTVSNSPKGVIIHQDPANKTVSVKSTIKITVSTGKIVYVPDFVDGTAGPNRGYDTAVTREEAIEMCESLGLIPVFVKESSPGRLPDEVWYQSLPAGSETSAGASVTLKYTPGAVFSVPDFTGMTKAEIISAGYGAKFTVIYAEYGSYVAGQEGRVIEQSVLPGRMAAAGSKVTVCLGPEH